MALASQYGHNRCPENNDTFNIKLFVVWQDNFWTTTKNVQQSPDLNYNVQCDLNTIIRKRIFIAKQVRVLQKPV